MNVFRLLALTALLLPGLAQAQLASLVDNSKRPQPVDPVVAAEHEGMGRLGVRLFFDKTTGYPVITALIRGGPAYDAGLRIGDSIIRVGRNYTNTLSDDDVRLSLHGQAGTSVELTVQRNDDPNYIVIAIERRLLPAYVEETLDSSQPLPDEKP